MLQLHIMESATADAGRMPVATSVGYLLQACASPPPNATRAAEATADVPGHAPHHATNAAGPRSRTQGELGNSKASGALHGACGWRSG